MTTTGMPSGFPLCSQAMVCKSETEAYRCCGVQSAGREHRTAWWSCRAWSVEGDDLHVPFAMNTFMGRRRRRESMSLRSATDLFSEWADVGRDEGMERGHSASVEVMLMELLEGWYRPFRDIEMGCGNCWVVRRLSAHALCSHASGVDGAPSMIAKARTIDPDGDYIEAMLPEWTPGAPYDLVHTMECLYYLEDPLGFLQTLHDEWTSAAGSSSAWTTTRKTRRVTIGALPQRSHGASEHGRLDVWLEGSGVHGHHRHAGWSQRGLGGTFVSRRIAEINKPKGSPAGAQRRKSPR